LEEMKIITTILQKPLIGMHVKSNNESIELKEAVSNLDSQDQNIRAN
jgi:hypothetical protein